MLKTKANDLSNDNELKIRNKTKISHTKRNRPNKGKTSKSKKGAAKRRSNKTDRDESIE